MPAVDWTQLESDELLHLAVEAGREGRHGEAIAYLKHSLERSRASPLALYLLAAQHAQIGLAARAIDEFTEALSLAPDLHPARFQLGLLLLCSGRLEEALAALQPLQDLPASNPYRHFARALERLCQDDFGGCRDSMALGLQLNDSNLALNIDMQRLLGEIETRVQDSQRSPAQRPGEILLSAYTKTVN